MTVKARRPLVVCDFFLEGGGGLKNVLICDFLFKYFHFDRVHVNSVHGMLPGVSMSGSRTTTPSPSTRSVNQSGGSKIFRDRFASCNSVLS